MKKKILITGDRGFIGRQLCSDLAALGHQVIGLNALQSRQGYPALRFGDTLNRILHNNVFDAVVHSAYARCDPTGEINYSGTRSWAQECSQVGINFQLFLSSISATVVPSAYGKSKARLDNFFSDFGGVSLRLGLVMGKGGVFATLCGLIRRFHFFPLLNGGRNPVFPVFAPYLAEVISLILKDFESNTGQIKYLYEPVDIVLAEFLKMMAKELGVFYWGIPCPYWIMALPVFLLEKTIPFRTPITRDNLLGLRFGVELAQESDLIRFLPDRLPLQEQLGLAVKSIVCEKNKIRSY